MNKIICGDCAEIMKGMPDGYIDLTVTSPPYGTKVRKYKGFVFDFEATAQQLYRVMKPGGVLCWVIGDTTAKGDRTGEPYRQVLRFKEIGFLLHDVIAFVKTGTTFPSKHRYTNAWEQIFVLSKDTKPKTIHLIADIPRRWLGSFSTTTHRQADGSLKKSKAANCGLGSKGRAKGTEYGFRTRDNIWTYKNGYGFSQPDPDLAKQHSAVFPLALACDCIISWSNPGDIVLDPMSGSATTCKAAKGLGRDYLGIEVSPDYVKLGKQRVALVGKGEYLNDEEKTGYKI